MQPDKNGGGPASVSPAHESIDTVAAFRLWRSFRFIVVGGEMLRLHDAGGIVRSVERAAKDGRTGARHQGWLLAENGGGPASVSPAHESIDTVAAFRLWRSFRFIVVGG